MVAPTSCKQCGSNVSLGDKFCAMCGTSISIGMLNVEDRSLTMDILTLKNNILDVVVVGDDRIDIKGQSFSKWLLGRVTITFDGRLKLNFQNKTVRYWDSIKKTSIGLGGLNTGLTKETYIVKGLERSGGGIGILPSGQTYRYDFGMVRELVRSIVEKHGWTFEVTLRRP